MFFFQSTPNFFIRKMMPTGRRIRKKTMTGLKKKKKNQHSTHLSWQDMRKISKLKPEGVGEVGGAGVPLQTGGTDGRRARFVSYNQRRVR